MKKILITKETRAGETRVALLPSDVAQLIKAGNQVIVEQSAGIAADCTDQDYRVAGATILPEPIATVEGYQQHFADIDIIVRVKRPERAREVLESQTLIPGTIMIGALDPLEHDAMHVDEYRAANINAYSIDQVASLPPQHPLNLLSGMSQIAGELALQNALDLSTKQVHQLVIVGFGVAGRSAFHTALKKGLAVTVVSINTADLDEVGVLGATGVLLDKNSNLAIQQAVVAQALNTADIVITAARDPGKKAPQLIPAATLMQMPANAVIVDLALSEGGNVEGSRHDETLVLGNQITVTNTSGYPKMFPARASAIWSKASLHFVLLLIANDMALIKSSQITRADTTVHDSSTI
jgi:NAD/NADP transhydrogenase alpha subunit